MAASTQSGPWNDSHQYAMPEFFNVMGVFNIMNTPFKPLNANVQHRDPLKVRCLYEADMVLSRCQAFSKQIKQIYMYKTSKSASNGVQQTLPFSLMKPSEMLDVIKSTYHPTQILEMGKLMPKGIEQFYANVEGNYKFQVLMDMHDSINIPQSVIFCNSNRKVEWLSEKMNGQGFCTMSLHASMPQKERNEVMATFRSGSNRVLISTDVFARGIMLHAASCDVQRKPIMLDFDPR